MSRRYKAGSLGDSALCCNEPYITDQAYGPYTQMILIGSELYSQLAIPGKCTHHINSNTHRGLAILVLKTGIGQEGVE